MLRIWGYYTIFKNSYKGCTRFEELQTINNCRWLQAFSLLIYLITKNSQMIIQTMNFQNKPNLWFNLSHFCRHDLGVCYISSSCLCLFFLIKLCPGSKLLGYHGSKSLYLHVYNYDSLFLLLLPMCTILACSRHPLLVRRILGGM